MTGYYTTLRDTVQMQGIPLTEPEVCHIQGLLPIGEGTQEKHFFTSSLDTLRLSSTATYWQKIRNRLPLSLRQFIPSQDHGEMSQEDLSIDGKNYEGHLGNPDKLN